MAYTITEAQATELLKIADALVGKKISKGMISESDRKDYIQELMLIMVQHQNDWTVPEGVSFEAYANTVMEKRLINIWEKFHPKKDIMQNAVSLNEILKNDEGEEEEFISRLTEDGMMVNDAEISANWARGRLIAEVRLFVATLPDEERELCEILMYHNKVETARILGKHKQSVWRIMGRIREKMLTAGFQSPSQKNRKKLKKGVTFSGSFSDSQWCKDTDLQNKEKGQNQ